LVTYEDDVNPPEPPVKFPDAGVAPKSRYGPFSVTENEGLTPGARKVIVIVVPLRVALTGEVPLLRDATRLVATDAAVERPPHDVVALNPPTVTVKEPVSYWH